MHKRLILFLFSLLFSGLLGMSLMAQEATTTTASISGVTVEGPVSSINGNVVIVGDVAFELADGDPLLTSLQIGQMVRIQSSGDPDDDGSLDAVTVIVTGSPLSAATVNVVGEVEAIQLNVVTVAGYQIQFNATDPMLNNINVGDVVEVSGTTLNLGGVIVIVPSSVVIIIIGQPDATPESTPEGTPDPNATAEPTPEATPDDDDDDDDIIIVIEGPVTEINNNIIVIYNISIELDADDPLLTVIQIGDVIHIEGNWVSNGTTIIVVAVVVVIVDVDIVIDGDFIWRDNGNCGNPPPAWAPANGWRRKCENRGGGSGRGSRSS